MTEAEREVFEDLLRRTECHLDEWREPSRPNLLYEHRDRLVRLLGGYLDEPAVETVWKSEWPKRTRAKKESKASWRFPMAGSEWKCHLFWCYEWNYSVRIEYGPRVEMMPGISDEQANDLLHAEDAKHFWKVLRKCVPEWDEALRARIDGWEWTCRG